MKSVIVKGNCMQIIRALFFTLIIISQGNLAKETLNVNYSSNIEPIAINVMHEWILTIESADGYPVTLYADPPSIPFANPTKVRPGIRPHPTTVA